MAVNPVPRQPIMIDSKSLYKLWGLLKSIVDYLTSISAIKPVWTVDSDGGLAIASGSVPGKSFVHKFGYAPDFDTSDNEVTVWHGASDGTAWEKMMYTYSTSADIDSISSSSASDTVEMFVEGLDANYAYVAQVVTLQGQTRTALTTPLLRVFRSYNNGATDLVGHVVIYVNTALTAGVPTDKSKIRAIIDPNSQQTTMCVYTIPAGKTGYMRSWNAATAGASKTSNYIMRVYSRLPGKVFRLKHIAAISDAGSSSSRVEFIDPEVYPEKTDIEMTTQMTAVGGSGASISGGFDIVLLDN